jgi:hypothetical protein
MSLQDCNKNETFEKCLRDFLRMWALKRTVSTRHLCILYDRNKTTPLQKILRDYFMSQKNIASVRHGCFAFLAPATKKHRFEISCIYSWHS